MIPIGTYYITLKNRALLISYYTNAHSYPILFISVIQKGGFMTACQLFPPKTV